MYIHDSVKVDRFINDKKLNLLKHGVITIGQFVQLLDINDPYTLIGPAIVAKDSINEFISEWKNSVTNIKTLEESFIENIKPETIIANLNELLKIFPEINSLVQELRIKLESTSCPICERNKYVLRIINEINLVYKERDLGNMEEFVNAIINKYYPFRKQQLLNNNLDDLDILWVKPDTLIGLGKDLINGLSNCFDCCKKHLSRAKAFYEEWQQGYPEHNTLMYNEFVEANKNIEEGYVLFWDSLGQLDMASSELVGSHLADLDVNGQTDIIELANKIRTARILFQEDSSKVPDWNHLRVEVQRLQNKLNKLKQYI